MEVRKLGRWLRRRAENIAAAMVAVMFAAFVLQILFRYFLNFPVGWTSELSVVLWLWLVLWGAAFVVKERDEIRFDLLSELAGRRVRIVMGMVAALALSRFGANLLFGVSAFDPLTYLAVAGLLLGVAAIACYFPARRATKLDPVTALRLE